VPVNRDRTSHDVWGAAIAVEAALSLLLVLVLIFLWGLTGAGYFWPKWVLFALAVPLVIQIVIRLALNVPDGRLRALAIHGAVSGWVAAVLITVYALAGGGTFWPLWAVATLGLAFGTHAIVVVALPSLRPQERELAARVDQLTRTRAGALDVQAAELRRIERDLHDGAQARLVALSMQLGRAEERLEDRPEVAQLVRAAREEAGAAIGELRDLARGIAPPVLADRGLEAAVEALGKRSPMPVTVTASLGRRPPPVVETAAYFVAAEALTNAAKHAGGAAAHVTLSARDGRLVVEVGDEGPGGAEATGTGLTGLRHRVEALDGTLLVTSPAGIGTTVRAELPCES
jgi:signal transduction histidine kinase